MKYSWEKFKNGFTLVELITVISIIAIIMTVAIFSFNNTREDSRNNKRVLDIKQIQLALEKYYSDNGSYPNELIFGQALVNDNGKTYMKNLPTNPMPRNDGDCPDEEYQYEYNISTNSYLLYFCISRKTGDLEGVPSQAEPSGLSGLACTDRTYTEWSECSPEGEQIREILTSLPTGCTGGDPVLSQSCTVPKGFATEWTVSGDAEGRTITLPLYNSGTFNFTVYWGDGSSSEVLSFDSPNRIHTYSQDGVYEVQIVGECPAWSFNNAGDKLKITDIIYWGDNSRFGGFSHLAGGFYGATNIKSLGEGKIIAKGTLVSLYQAFRGLSKISYIPEGLFDNCTNLTSNGFRETFYGCSSLTSIPTDLFRYNTLVSTSGFHSTFYGCSSLTSVPEELFRYNINVSTYGFYRTFYGCNKLQLNPWIFYADGEQNTRFLDRDSDFGDVFYRWSFTGTQGTAPDLWNCDFGSGTPNRSGAFLGGGNNVSSLTNYNDIPSNWK